MHVLVLHHLRGVWRDPDRLAGDPGAPHLASATTELVRALLSRPHTPRSPRRSGPSWTTPCSAGSWPTRGGTSPIAL
ncbi:hypothetical protein LT493_00860 [Streptomyces tricolor]|nr:hypothetical protein [Streptomyces tricolor]